MNNTGCSTPTSPGGINNTAGRSDQIARGDAQQSNAPRVRHVDIAWLGAVGAAGLFVDGWSKNGGGSHQTQPLVLVPEAGIEPAWAC